MPPWTWIARGFVAADRARVAALVVVAAVAATGCTKQPDRAAAAAAAAAAVAAKDGAAVWRLLDKATQGRVIAGLTRAQAQAKTDDRWHDLFAAANAPVDTAQPPEALAVALVAAQLAGPAPFPADDGKAAHAHVEGGAWRLTLEPTGFVEGDTPLTLTLRAPGAAARTPAAGVTELSIDVDATDRFTGEPLAADEFHKRLAEATTHAAQQLGFPPHHAEGAARVILYYRVYGGAVDSEFKLDAATGDLRPIVIVYDQAIHKTAPRPQPVLRYGAW